jgi:putative inorganic carbon (HCO3(-)) transporter
MDMVGRTLSRQREALLVVLFVSAVSFWRGTFDVFNTVKATVFVLGAVVIGLWSVRRVWLTGRVVYPATSIVGAVGLLVVGLVTATLTSATPWRSVVGLPGRHTGLAPYLAYALLFAATVRLYAQSSPAPVATAVLAAGAPVALYGLLQAGGLDPFAWQVVEGGPPVFSTFGNANFFSAYLGAVVPLAVWAALSQTWGVQWRVLLGVLGIAAFAAAVASRSAQGPGAALVGAAFMAGVWACTTPPKRARRRLMAAGMALVALAAGALLAGGGPAAAVRAEVVGSLATRVPKWQAALAMFRDRPFLGFGLDTYGDWFYAYRSPALAAMSGLGRSVDNPHNVLLHMLTGGGLLLAAGWVVFAGMTAYALVHGLRRLQGEDRLLLGGLGGAWLAYQVQSLVSIDVPPLAGLHFILAGAIVALGVAPPLREWALPLRARPPAATHRPRCMVEVPLATTALALAVGGLVWVITAPVRADQLAQSAAVAADSQDSAQAMALYDRAIAIAFWEPRYPAIKSAWLAQMGRQSEALDAQLLAARRDPRGLAHTLNVARLYAVMGNGERAAQWYDRALQIDPSTPVVLVEVGRFRLWEGDMTGAVEALERALAIDPTNAEATRALVWLQTTRQSRPA